MFLGFVAIVATLLLMLVSTSGSSKNRPDSRGHSPDASSPILPPSEASFIEIVSTAQRDSRQTENDMQKGGVKAKRDKSICSAMSSAQVQDWIGTVRTIDSNSDGKGVLAIEIAPDVLVKTWNNAFSDIGSDTLIEPGSPVFAAASAMKGGQLVTFSGTFFQGSDGDCFSEGSLSLNGKVQSPQFIFQFSKVSKYDPAQRNATAPPIPTPAADPAQPTDAPQSDPSEAPTQAEAIPRELWGTWSIARNLGVAGITACNESFAKSLIGTQIEYSPEVFRWKDVTVKQPNVQSEAISPEKLSEDYRVGFDQLGLPVSSANQITIKHPDPGITGATTEMPGDAVFMKNPSSIVFPICGSWFEATLIAPPSQN